MVPGSGPFGLLRESRPFFEMNGKGTGGHDVENWARKNSSS